MHILDCSEEKLPVIIDIHGGGFMYGDKNLNEYYCMRLAQKGFCVVTMSYTLMPYTNIKGQVHDIFASFKWVAENIDIYKGDTNNVFLTGDSAGGYLAQLCAILNVDKKYQRIYGVKSSGLEFKAMGLTSTLCNIDYFLKANDEESVAKTKFFLGDSAKKLQGTENVAKMITKENFPPTFIVSAEDDITYNKYSVELDKLLNKIGAMHESKFFKSNGKHTLSHVFNVSHSDWEESNEANTMMTDFFKKFLK